MPSLRTFNIERTVALKAVATAVNSCNGPDDVAQPGPSFFYDYTVFVGGGDFTVTEPSDTQFPDYFATASWRRTKSQTYRPAGLLSRLAKWMAQLL